MFVDIECSSKADEETTNQPTNLFTIAITLYTTLTHTQAYIVVCVMVFFIFFKNNRTEYFLLLLVSCLTKLKSEIHPLRLKGFLGVLGVSIYIYIYLNICIYLYIHIHIQ